MGRFATTVEFYARYREPYSPAFFRAAAERLGFDGDEALLDIGCGPGPLAIGFAPFVRRCEGIDPEPGMIEAGQAAAERAGARVVFHLGRMEDFPAGASFDVVTIGRALHWLDRRPALEVLERIVSEKGLILICRPTSIETPATPWLKRYEEVCRVWSNDPDRRRYRLDVKDWFEGSRFHLVDRISVTETRRVSVEDLIGRALSKSNTSPAVMGGRQAEFAAEIRAALAPFAEHGELEEQIAATAMVFSDGVPAAASMPSVS